jgi:hypothetical protein
VLSSYGSNWIHNLFDSPTSVNLVASTLTKGESVIFASLRAISVFPHPVGPIMRMFLGTISSRRDGSLL